MNKVSHLKHIEIPEVSPSSLNEKVLKNSEILATSLAAARNITEVEKGIETKFGIPTGTQRRWKTQLRRLYGLPPRSSLILVLNHPQFRKAAEYIVARKKRKEAVALRSGKNLVVIPPSGNSTTSVEGFLVSSYFEEGMNATATFRRLLVECEGGRVLILPSQDRCPLAKLPSLQNVRRFLRKKIAELGRETSSIRDSGASVPSDGKLYLQKELKENLRRDADLVVDCCKRVYRTLGSKHREIVYHRALKREFELCSISFKDEEESDIPYRGIIVGKERVDFLVGSGLVVEIKARKSLLPEDFEQAKRYLRDFKRKLCLLVNFGSRRLQIKRFQNSAIPRFS